MKSKEEIEQLAEKNFPIEQYPTNEGFENFAYKQGYNQCQQDMADKKYTEEDVRNAIREGRNSIHFENDGSWWEDETVEEDFINSLNKQD